MVSGHDRPTDYINCSEKSRRVDGVWNSSLYISYISMSLTCCDVMCVVTSRHQVTGDWIYQFQTGFTGTAAATSPNLDHLHEDQ